MLTALRQTGAALKSLTPENFRSLEKILSEQLMEAREAALDIIERATGTRPDVSYFDTNQKEFKVATVPKGKNRFVCTWRWNGKLIIRQTGKITQGREGYEGEWTTESFA